MASLAYAQNCQITDYEGALITLNPEAFDPDPEIGPAGMLLWEFGYPFNEDGQWQTRKGQRGIFPFYLSVSDGELKDTVHACVELLPNNQNPILNPLEEIYITRGEATQISASCYDPDGDMVQLSFRFEGKDVAYIQYEPPGTYNLDVICTDGFGGIDSERTKLHILMPEMPEEPIVRHTPWVPPEMPEPEPIDIQHEDPQDVELILPKAEEPACPTLEPVEPEEVDLILPETCPPESVDLEMPGTACAPEVVDVITPAPQPYDVEIVTPQPYDVDIIYPAEQCKPCADCLPCPECQPCPDCPVCAQPEQEDTGCGVPGTRKEEINRILNPCCEE